MFIGHDAVAFAGKRIFPATPLAWSLLAVNFIDLLWPIFLLLGWERVEIRAGTTAMNPLDFVHYPITHSLVGCALWGAALGALYFAVRRDRRGAWWIAAAVLSHWALDLIVHRPDLPLWPGGGPRVGLGLWNVPPVSVAIELVLFAAGIALYVRSTRARGLAGSISLWSLVLLLLVLYVSSVLGPPPPDARTLAWVAMAAWIVPLWGVWIDRTREARAATPP